MNRTRPRALLIASALLICALAFAPSSQAAGPSRCKTLAGKRKVVVKGSTSMVVVSGTRDNLNQTFFGCLYARPSLFKLPGQNGGDTERFGKFTLAGRFVAYEHVNVEEASNLDPAFIGLVDLRQRKRLYERDAIPLTKNEENFGAVSAVTQILLRKDGAVAWIGREENSKRTVVRTVLPAQKTATEVDKGKDIATHSLLRVAGDSTMFSWVRAGTRKTATFGGPAPTP